MYKHRFLHLCFAIILVSVLSLSSAVFAAEIIAVQSIDIKPYNDVLEGFKSACKCNVTKLVTSEMNGEDVKRAVLKADPDIILATGIDALRTVKDIRKIPVIYTMVLSSETLTSGNTNISGICMRIAPETQLPLIKKAVPGIKAIGLIYDPSNTGDFVKEIKNAAGNTGIRLVAGEIHRPKDFPRLLNSIKKEINAFWMLPDVTAVTPETVEFLLLFSFENKIPVFTFSDKYLKMGALMSLGIDAYDIGRQAGETAVNILSGAGVQKAAKINARKANLTFNKNTAGKLGITFSKDILRKGKIINRK